MKLSVITPAYNEEESIASLHTRLTRILSRDGLEKGYDFELILVNDGSRDHTLDEIKKLAALDSKVRYISFSRNFGKEAAMLAGLTYCQGDFAVIMDSDLQHPPELIPDMMQESFKGFDQVIAKRTRQGDKKGRTFLSKLYYRLVNHFIDVTLEDGVGDFRLLSRKAIDAYTAATRLDPDYAQAYAMISHAWTDLGTYADASGADQFYGVFSEDMVRDWTDLD